jgi:hypothetical protein
MARSASTRSVPLHSNSRLVGQPNRVLLQHSKQAGSGPPSSELQKAGERSLSPTRSSGRSWLNGPRTRSSAAARSRNWCGTPRQTIRDISFSSRAPRREEKPWERHTAAKYLMSSARWDVRPRRRSTTRPINRSPRRCRNTGPTSQKPGILMAASSRAGQSLIRRHVGISTSRMPAP